MHRGIPLLGVAWALALVACGGGQEGGGPVASSAATSTPQTTVPAAPTTTTPLATTASSIAGSTEVVPTTPSTKSPLPDADSVFHTLLAKIPDHDGSLEFVLATNFERAADVFDAPDRITDPENWHDALFLDRDGALAPQLVITSRDLDEWRAEVGFSRSDELGEAIVRYGHEKLDLLLVDVDAAAIDLAVRTDPAWSDVLIDAEVNGTPYYAWGEVDRSDEVRHTATHVDAWGGYMAVADHVVLRTPDEDVLDAALTVMQGQSLADNPDVALILDSFAEHRVYSMALTDDIHVALLGIERLMVLPYRLLGTGQAFVGDQRQTVLAYVHDDHASAIENAARLDTILTNEVGADGVPYADIFSSFRISVDGVLVSVVLNMNPPGGGFWYVSLLRDEPLYWADGGATSGG